MHQYLARRDGGVVTEQLFGDLAVHFLYNKTREHAPWLFNALTGPRVSSLLAYLNFDSKLTSRLLGNTRFLQSCGVTLDECIDPPEAFDTPRKIFERKIRFWDTRPLPGPDWPVVSPADGRVIVGSLTRESQLFIKDKFFAFEELLGLNRPDWLQAFDGGEFAIVRLTPDKYHFNHAPVSGVVVDHYEIAGSYHACNPVAVVQMVTPYSKNKRVVTIIDTDVEGGSGVGLVAMIEVVAMMIGEVVQCASAVRYADPKPVQPGLRLERGGVKSLYRPGSSTTIVLLQKDRTAFAPDLIQNRLQQDVKSRFSELGSTLVETEVAVRSALAAPRKETSS